MTMSLLYLFRADLYDVKTSESSKRNQAFISKFISRHQELVQAWSGGSHGGWNRRPPTWRIRPPLPRRWRWRRRGCCSTRRACAAGSEYPRGGRWAIGLFQRGWPEEGRFIFHLQNEILEIYMKRPVYGFYTGGPRNSTAQKYGTLSVLNFFDGFWMPWSNYCRHGSVKNSPPVTVIQTIRDPHRWIVPSTLVMMGGK